VSALRPNFGLPKDSFVGEKQKTEKMKTTFGLFDCISYFHGRPISGTLILVRCAVRVHFVFKTHMPVTTDFPDASFPVSGASRVSSMTEVGT